MAASSLCPDPATTASLELLRPLLAALSSLLGIVQALNRNESVVNVRTGRLDSFRQLFSSLN
jgi:putative heme degradation protein